MKEAMKVEELDGAASGLSDVLGLLASDFESHPLSRSIDDCEAAGRAMREAKDTIDMLQSWEADATARAELLEQHLRYVLEIARTWQPEYATPVDRATLNMAEMLLTPNTQVQAGPAGFMAGIAPGTDRLERLTHEDLRRWGAALDKEMPRGIGERLLRFADDWRKSIEIEREECARVCDRMLDPDYVRDADECAAAIRVRLDCGNTNNA